MKVPDKLDTYEALRKYAYEIGKEATSGNMTLQEHSFHIGVYTSALTTFLDKKTYDTKR